jgi:hypothetical protein
MIKLKVRNRKSTGKSRGNYAKWEEVVGAGDD